MVENKELSKKIEIVTQRLCTESSEIAVAVINLETTEPEIAGYNIDKFIYPASIYKVFVAAEILRQIELGERKLEDKVKIESPNYVDRDVRFFPKSTYKDHRPLLREGDEATLDYLLDLMLTRSDNVAANVLVDVATRENINRNIILPNKWDGSEVTRKFLNRLAEEKEYRISKITVSSVRHLAEFFHKVETGNLVSPWVSEKLKGYMLRWNRKNGRSSLYIPEFKSYYDKGGWLEINGYKWNIWMGLKAAWHKGYAIIRYSGTAGVIRGENSHYAIAVLTITKTRWPWKKFPMKKLSQQIYKIMENGV